MENLQCEVLELEFNEFSRGMATITEEEFAHILLRYTILTHEEKEEYMERLRQRIPESKVRCRARGQWGALDGEVVRVTERETQGSQGCKEMFQR